MNRRDFLRRAAVAAAGVVAADQLELLERLAHRKVWPGAALGPTIVTLDSFEVAAILRRIYGEPAINAILPESPLLASMGTERRIVHDTGWRPLPELETHPRPDRLDDFEIRRALARRTYWLAT